MIPPERLSKSALRHRLCDAVLCCADCGQMFGTYVTGSSSTHKGTCHVCGADAWVTDTRDYDYFRKTLYSLTK